MNVFLDSVMVSFEDAPEKLTVGGVFTVIFNFLKSKGRAIFKTIVDEKIFNSTK